MAAERIAITLDTELLNRIDQLVATRQYASRSWVVQEAVREKLKRLDRTSLAKECKKLDSRVEQEIAEQGMSGDVESWPEY
jgi:metal-responsive CopG/Arc/MetJ family transcriptional regulator